MQDSFLTHLIQQEYVRQRDCINLIASENFVSQAVLDAQGSILTNKYAEGYPGKRYYGGCQIVDAIEEIAIDRAKKLFQCQFANVQPHSGSQANQAVYLAFLKPGDRILAMDLAAGGHLSHGSRVNLSGLWFDIVPYGVDRQTHRIDMDHVRQLALQHRPKMIIAGASSYARIIDFQAFRSIADEVNALLMADIAHIAGLIAGKMHPSPFPHAHVVTSTTHKTLRGPRGGLILSQDESIARRIDQAIFPGLQGGPLMHVIAAKAVCFQEALQKEFQDYAQTVVSNTRALAAELAHQGLSLVSGGTDNHLVLIDLGQHQSSGKRIEQNLTERYIACNKNAIPYDPRPPQQASGIRLGSAAMTTRGLREADMTLIARWIAECIHQPNIGPESFHGRVRDLCERYPLPTHCSIAQGVKDPSC